MMSCRPGKPDMPICRKKPTRKTSFSPRRVESLVPVVGRQDQAHDQRADFGTETDTVEPRPADHKEKETGENRSSSCPVMSRSQCRTGRRSGKGQGEQGPVGEASGR